MTVEDFKYKTDEGEITIELKQEKNEFDESSISLAIHRRGDFSIHHAIEECFTALSEFAKAKGVCHSEQEYWTRLYYIAKEKI